MTSFYLWEQYGKNTYLLFYILSAIALTHTHITGWSLVVALFLYQVINWTHRKPTRKVVLNWMGSHLLVALVFLLWFIPVAINKMEVGHVAQGWFFAQHESGYWITHLTNFLINGEQRMPVRSITALLSLVLLLASVITFATPTWWQRVRHFFARDRWPLDIEIEWSSQIRFLLFCLLVPLLIGFGLQVTVTKYLLVCAAPLFLLLGHGAARLGKSKQISAMIIFLIVLLVAPLHIRLYSEPRHHWDKAAETISSYQSKYPDAIIVAHSFAYALPLQRYLPENLVITPFYPLKDGLTFDQRVVRYNWQGIATYQDANYFVANVSAKAIILLSSTPDMRDQDPLKSVLFSQGWRILEAHTWNGYGDPEVLLLGR
jgi:hypothetical protein